MTYKPTSYHKNNAKDLGVKITPSKAKGKKLQVELPDGKIKQIGVQTGLVQAIRGRTIPNTGDYAAVLGDPSDRVLINQAVALDALRHYPELGPHPRGPVHVASDDDGLTVRFPLNS